MFTDEPTDSKNEFCERRRSSDRRALQVCAAGREKWFAAFRTNHPAIRAVEYTILAPSIKDARAIARSAAKQVVAIGIAEID